MSCADDEFEPLCNFEVEVVGSVEIISDNGTIPAAEFIMHFYDGTVSDKIVKPLDGPKGLTKLDWYAVHPRVAIYKGIGKTRQNLTNVIRAALPGVKQKKLYSLGSLGTHIIEGESVFNTGGGLIRPPPRCPDIPTIIPEPTGYRLDINPNLSEREAAAEMMKVVNLSPDAGRLIFSQTLLYIMRMAYELAWRSPRVVLFIHDETGLTKTTLISFLTQLYNRVDGIRSPFRLDSSIPKAEELLYEVDDWVVVLDDLFPTKFRDVQVQQEKTLEQITRTIADGVSRGRKGVKVSGKPTKSGVILTGEYPIGMGSTAARLLLFQFSTPVDDVKLRECLSKPLVLSTFFHFYITWFIANFDMIKELLARWWDKYTRIDMRVHKRLTAW